LVIFGDREYYLGIMTMELPARIKIVRDKLGLSQKDMAKKIGVSLTALQGYEAGRSVPGGEVFKSITKLGFNANWLLTGEGPIRRGERSEQGAEPAKEVEDTKKADRSPVKQAAVSYIDGMTDVQVSKVITLILSQQDVKSEPPVTVPKQEVKEERELSRFEELSKDMTPEEKEEFRQVLEDRFKQILEEESENDQTLRRTGT
jgi:transcriptional regulator with XRE-family HTH domain